MAWLMAFLSLLITIVVIAGLFFGGRWLYRTITEDDKPSTVTISTPSGSQTGTDSSNPNSQEATPSEDYPSVVSDEAASTTTPSTSAPTASAPSSSATAGASTTASAANAGAAIPNTGAEDILFILPVVAVIGYLVSVKRQNAK